jgi:predicted nucleotidyltransferase
MSSISYDTISVSLFPKARRGILRLLLGHPDRAFYLREIVARTGLGVGSVQRELERLCRGGILRRSQRGSHVFFQANEACPVYEELRGLVKKTVGAIAVLGKALHRLADRIALAFVYGSVARGDERSESDLDLMVIGDVSFAEVVEAIRGAESDTGRAIHATVCSADEIRTKLAGGHHFIRSLVKSEKLFIAGSEDELRRLLEEQLDTEP